jgi:hypothetical protein
MIDPHEVQALRSSSDPLNPINRGFSVTGAVQYRDGRFLQNQDIINALDQTAKRGLSCESETEMSSYVRFSVECDSKQQVSSILALPLYPFEPGSYAMGCSLYPFRYGWSEFVIAIAPTEPIALPKMLKLLYAVRNEDGIRLQYEYRVIRSRRSDDPISKLKDLGPDSIPKLEEEHRTVCDMYSSEMYVEPDFANLQWIELDDGCNYLIQVYEMHTGFQRNTHQ